MSEYAVAVRRAGGVRQLAWLAGRILDWASLPSAGVGWPPSYVDLTRGDGSFVQTLAGPMDAVEAAQLVAQVRGDLEALDRAEFEEKYLG